MDDMDWIFLECMESNIFCWGNTMDGIHGILWPFYSVLINDKENYHQMEFCFFNGGYPKSSNIDDI